MAEDTFTIHRRPPRWKFTISCDSSQECVPTSIGVDMNDFNLFDKLALVCGDVYSDWEKDGRRHKALRINESADSPKLKDLIAMIEAGLGFQPSRSRIVPVENRGTSFGLIRESVFSGTDIERSRFVQLIASKYQIGTWTAPSEEELAAETYVVENDACQKTKVEFGFVSPFPALGINGPLKRKLEAKRLEAALFEPIFVRRKSGSPRKPLWKIWSSVILPRAQTRLVTSQGEDKVPWDDFSDRWSAAYYDDLGCFPPLLEYRENEISQLPSFDVALTAEHTGNCRDRVFRTTIISQRFRAVLEKLKVKGVQYVPVSLT